MSIVSYLLTTLLLIYLLIKSEVKYGTKESSGERLGVGGTLCEDEEWMNKEIKFTCMYIHTR